jgi:8-oxo-dGTP diphosphatase
MIGQEMHVAGCFSGRPAAPSYRAATGWRGSRLSSAAMVNRDGNGWTRCGRGHRHWGRFGAAGLLACAPDEAGQDLVLLQRRNGRGNHGGTWGPPGGARDSHESAVAAALREAAEECAVPPDAVSVRGILRDDHGGWSYQTVLVAAAAPFDAYPASSETSDVAWVPVPRVAQLALHPGFAEQWPVLRAALPPLTVIVDAANVMGSRPDGWWRDRAGAAARLRGQLAALAADGVPGLPESVGAPLLERWFPCFALVLEGAARSAGPDDGDGRWPGDRVRTVLADGSGDDAIAGLARELAGRRLVVTADRELRERCLAAGAAVAGPRWLLGLL